MRELGEVRRGVRLWWWSHIFNPPVKSGEEGGAGACRTALQSKELSSAIEESWAKILLERRPLSPRKEPLKYGRHAQPLAWNSPCKAWPQCQCSFGFQSTHSCGWGSVEYSYGHYGDPVLMFCNLCAIMYGQPSICHHVSNNGAKEEGSGKLV